MQTNYKKGDIVFWMYRYCGEFPEFYKVTKVSEKSIWVCKIDSKNANIEAGFSSYDKVPNEDSIVGKERRLSKHEDGSAYVDYYGRKQRLHIWDGKPIKCCSC